MSLKTKLRQKMTYKWAKHPYPVILDLGRNHLSTRDLRPLDLYALINSHYLTLFHTDEFCRRNTSNNLGPTSTVVCIGAKNAGAMPLTRHWLCRFSLNQRSSFRFRFGQLHSLKTLTTVSDRYHGHGSV